MAFSFARCASSRAPQGWLSKLDQVQRQAFGAWVSLERRSGETTVTLSGELIAVEGRDVLLLGEKGIVQIPVSEVEKTRVEIFHEARKAALWATLGTLSTISHGIGLIISAPIWISVGIGYAAGESRTGMMEFSGIPLDEIRKFARFPQGLPRGVDLNSLKLKSTQEK
jgi:hypothetical protein